MSAPYMVELHRPYGTLVQRRTYTTLAGIAERAHRIILAARRQAGPYAVFVHRGGVEIPLDQLADARPARQRGERKKEPWTT